MKRSSTRKLEDCISEALHDSDLRKFLFGLEEKLINFLENPSLQRLDLGPMPPKERLLAHKLAERFIFDSPSEGDGENRHIVITKTFRSKPYV